MIARRAVVAVTLLLLALTVVPSPAWAALTPNLTCPGRTPLVDVSYRFANEQLLNSEGEVWGLGSGYAQFRLYPAGVGAFCGVSTVAGPFTTYGGPSPGGTGTVPAGLGGYVVGTTVLRFAGTFAPMLPTRGFVGFFDAGCDQFECATPIQFGRKYIDVTGPPSSGGLPVRERDPVRDLDRDESGEHRRRRLLAAPGDADELEIRRSSPSGSGPLS